jgi:hypothetical protein
MPIVPSLILLGSKVAVDPEAPIMAPVDCENLQLLLDGTEQYIARIATREICESYCADWVSQDPENRSCMALYFLMEGVGFIEPGSNPDTL